MTPIKRPLAAAGAAVLLGLTLTACGGGYPTDASEKEFCGGFEDIITATSAVKGDEPTEGEWEDIQKAYEDLGEIGTPEGISTPSATGSR